MVFVRSFVQSGAKINISDSSCPERIVTVTGTTEQIYKAFSMITKKFEDVSSTPIVSTTRAIVTSCGGAISTTRATSRHVAERSVHLNMLTAPPC